jgi:hypothetical protein
MGGMMSISVEAAAARDSLSNDKELIHTYEVDFSSSLTYQSTPLSDALMVIFYLSDSSLSSCLC